MGISWWRTSFGEPEIQGVGEAIRGEHISQGPLTRELEEAIAGKLGVPYAVVTTSGSAALFLALLAVGVGPGDEVIIPDRTWIATAHAVMLAGATPVLADVRADRPVLDLDDVRRKVTPRTKAVLPVHLNGRATDMAGLAGLAGEHGLHVVEDACQALFSRTPDGWLGTLSEVGCFSLGTTKLIATGQGGFVVTRSADIYERLRLQRNHGVVDFFADRWGGFGFNFKFTDILASIGLKQMERIEKRVAHCKEIYRLYAEGLQGHPSVRLLPVASESGELPLYAEVVSPQRERVIGYLRDRDIQTRPVPPAVHASSYIKSDGKFPHSDVFSAQSFYLPCGPEQPIDNVATVIDVLNAMEA